MMTDCTSDDWDRTMRGHTQVAPRGGEGSDWKGGGWGSGLGLKE